MIPTPHHPGLSHEPDPTIELRGQPKLSDYTPAQLDDMPLAELQALQRGKGEGTMLTVRRASDPVPVMRPVVKILRTVPSGGGQPYPQEVSHLDDAEVHSMAMYYRSLGWGVYLITVTDSPTGLICEAIDHGK